MILLCGIPSESPLALVRDELERLREPYALFNQRRWEEAELIFELDRGAQSGFIRIGAARWALEEVHGVYTRLMNEQLLPELKREPDGSQRRRCCRALHETLAEWYEIAPGRVVNRARPQGSNFSKPYQAQLIAAASGFAVPETLVTNDPDLVREFQAQHGRVIFKSISGLRSIVRELTPTDAARLDRIRWCSVQFQAFVEGTNVRVHTVGADDVFATAVDSEAADYRYAERDGDKAKLTPIELPIALAERCLRLATALGLPFSGIDLKLAPSGEVFCFEVNPSPAFSYYESHTGQPIARALAHYLVS